ncbi:MAG: EAL domain-containing protein [Clostridiales bacterium]|nr:EAL domain-containing protein [Clostridiales bacterium]
MEKYEKPVPASRLDAIMDAFALATYRLENSPALMAVRRGFSALMPVLIIGSFSLMMLNLPFPGWERFLSAAASGLAREVLVFMNKASMGFISAYLTITISYHYSALLKPKDPYLQGLSMVAAFSCFAALIEFYSVKSGASVNTSLFSSTGVFNAMLSAILGTRLFHLFYDSSFYSKNPRLYSDGADASIRSMVPALVPYGLCLFVFVMGTMTGHALFGVADFNDLAKKILLWIFNRAGDASPSNADCVFYIILLDLLWFFGIHGGNILAPVKEDLFRHASSNPHIFGSSSSIDVFAFIGGSGAALCLVAALLLFSRSKANKRLSLSALPFCLFNINEFIIFALPVIFNPFMLLPFVAAPVLMFMTAVLLNGAGFLPTPFLDTHWTTPVLFGGFYITQDLRGLLSQVIIIAVGTGVYAPFVLLQNAVMARREELVLQDLVLLLKKSEASGEPTAFLTRPDECGALARRMALELKNNLKAGGAVVLHYQAQVDENGAVIGAEALLRWRYNDRPVYAPLVVAIAVEEHIFDDLTRRIAEQSLRCALEMRSALKRPLKTSFNIKFYQLASPEFVEWIISAAGECGAGGYICLEITEDSAVINSKTLRENMALLRGAGISLAIDDFGMGATSIKYLKDGGFKYVKIDGDLVKDIPANKSSKEIVKSIVALGQAMGFDVIAEYVENETIRGHLLEIGVTCLQGYLYSPAVPFPEFIEFALSSPEPAPLPGPSLEAKEYEPPPMPPKFFQL